MNSKLIFLVVVLISIASVESSKEKGSKEKSEEVSIDCTFSSVFYTFFRLQPTCTLKLSKGITKKNTKIIAIGKECDAGNPNTVVRVFYALGRIVRYFPLGLDILFPNLIGFRFENTQLTVITKEDLQPFPDILMFACVGNQIQFLEQDLFKFNVKLQYVSFRSNRITYIDPAVFNVIKGTLQFMYMEGQALSCGLGDATSPAAVSRALSKLGTSACADISNAPPLYIMLLELKIQLGECEDNSETTTASSESTTGVETSTEPGSTTQSSTDTGSTTQSSTDTESTTQSSTDTESTTQSSTDTESTTQSSTDTESTTTVSETTTISQELETCRADLQIGRDRIDQLQADFETCQACRTDSTLPECQ